MEKSSNRNLKNNHQPADAAFLEAKMRLSTSFLVAGLIVSGAAASAQVTSEEICLRLAQGNLSDVSSSSTIQQSASDQINDFCSIKDRRAERLKSKSSGFNASIGAAGYKLGLGGNNASASSLTESDLDLVCDRGRQDFSSYYAANHAQELRSTSISTVASCAVELRKAQPNVERILGYVIPHASDPSLFHAEIYRNGPVGAAPWKFVGFSEEGLTCDKVAGQNAIGLLLREELGLTCHRKKSGIAQSGHLIFERGAAAAYEQRKVSFVVQGTAVDQAGQLRQEMAQANSRLENRISALNSSVQKALADFPSVLARLGKLEQSPSLTAAVKPPPGTNYVNAGCLDKQELISGLCLIGSGHAGPAPLLHNAGISHDGTRFVWTCAWGPGDLKTAEARAYCRPK